MFIIFSALVPTICQLGFGYPCGRIMWSVGRNFRVSVTLCAIHRMGEFGQRKLLQLR